MNIRTAQPSDSEAIVGLIQGILETEFPQDQSAYSPHDLSALNKTYEGPLSAFLIAEEDGQVVGTCGIKADGQEMAILRRFFVSPSVRGQGVGKQLLEAALTFCRERDFDEVIIRTSASMERAIALCLSMGFEEDGRWELGDVTLVRFVLRL